MTAAARDAAELLDHFSQIYLEQYWPREPHAAVGWADNAVLMLAYQDAAIAIHKYFRERPVRMLDISTGPALAPLLAMMTCVSEVQLSDFNPDNRRALVEMSIEYWRIYVRMLVRTFDRPDLREDELLGRLDYLRRQHQPVTVDLLQERPFENLIHPDEFELVSMQFVADSITSTEPDYLRCLGRALEMVRPGGGFIMSAVVDSSGWMLDGVQMPAPNVSEETILDFLRSQGFSLLNISRSMRLDRLTYSGGWIVLAAARERG